MTNQEMSQRFNLLFNNISSNMAPGVNEYEKSVFLTQAQKTLVIGLYNGSRKTPFESTEELTHYLAPLVSTASIAPETDQDAFTHLVSKSVLFKCPDNMMFRTFESCVLDDESLGCDTERTVAVIPVTQDEYWRTSRDPFRKDNKRKVLRLAFDDSSTGNASNYASDSVARYSELVSDYNIKSYLLRYLRYPSPIVLVNLDNGLEIDGVTTETPCLLNPALHEQIVLDAVALARAAWQ